MGPMHARTWAGGPIAWLALGCGGGGSDAAGSTSESTGAPTSTSEASLEATVPTTVEETADPTTPTTSVDDTTTATARTTTADASTTAGESSTGTSACPYAEVGGTPAFAGELVANEFVRPTQVVGHPDQPDRLLVTQLTGQLKVLEPGETTAPDDNAYTMSVWGDGTYEEGLFAAAYHPDFPSDPRVYLSYEPGDEPLRLRIQELAFADDDTLDPDSARTVIEIYQAGNAHFGSAIGFGPDDMLYIADGDGDCCGDPSATARDPGVLASKMLRIGVEPDDMPDDPLSCQGCPLLGPFDYTVPADNPFVDDDAFQPEVFAWGFRNPYRFAFDPPTGTLYLGDVGEGQEEEISIVAPGGDYGWSDIQGTMCWVVGCDSSPGPNGVNAFGQTMPIVGYGHDDGRCAVIGGAVYHSCEVPAWDGAYLYADHCTGEVFGLRWDGAEVEELGVLFTLPGRVFGMGTNEWGDVYFTVVIRDDLGAEIDGQIIRIAPER